MAALVRLTWWENGIEAIFESGSPGDGGYATRVHDSPILSAIALAAKRHEIDQRLLRIMVNSRSIQFENEQPREIGFLAEYCAESGPSFLELLQKFLVNGQVNEVTLDACNAVGTAWCLAQALRMRNDIEATAAREIHSQAMGHLLQARALTNNIETVRRRGLLLALTTEHRLREIEKADFEISRLGPPGPPKILRIGWAARRGYY
jgi:hypothetical protein